MARRVFISYQHLDRMKAKGFHLLRWNKNVDLEFVGRHLLDPVNSVNREYIRTKIKEQLKGSSVTVVLIGARTHESGWVADEIRWSLEKGNGVLGIKLSTAVRIPKTLRECGAEVIEWVPAEFAEAIERAFASHRRTAAILSAVADGSASCAR